MINMVRETGNSYYDYSQVENASADGAYSKNETIKKYFSESMNVNCNGWIGLKWDNAHQIDRAENDAKSSTAVGSHLSLAMK